MKGFRKVLSVVLSMAMVIALLPAISSKDIKAEATRYEAENADITNAGDINYWIDNDSDNSVTLHENEYIVFTLTSIANAGTYDIDMSYAGDYVDTIEATVNNGTPETFSVSNPGAWNNVIHTSFQVDLAAGTNTLIIKNLTSGDHFINVDYIEVSEHIDSTNYPSVIGKFEAEECDLTSSAVVLSNGNYAIFSNQAVVRMYNGWIANSKQYISKTVNVETAGKYKLTLAYTTPTYAVEFMVNVNNTGWEIFDDEAELVGYSAPATGSYYSEVANISTVLDLPAGVNTIQICQPQVDNQSSQDVGNLWTVYGGSWKTTAAFYDYFTIEAVEEETTEEVTEPEETTEEDTEEPQTYPNTEGRFEAENADVIVGNIESGDWYSTCSNSGVVGVALNWIGNTDSYKYVTWNVNAEEAGDYELTLSYCSEKPVEFLTKVNGGAWTSFTSLANVTGKVAPASGGWNAVSTVTTVITLQAGVNTISVSGPVLDNSSGEGNFFTVFESSWNNAGGANIDCIDLAKYVEPTTTYDISIDGIVVDTVEENTVYTLPTTATYGYLSGDDLYKPGATFTVTGDITLTSINTVSISMEPGASIKMEAPAGIAYVAQVAAPDALLNSTALTAGIIITYYDNYTEQGNSTLDLNSSYAKIDIANTGEVSTRWRSNQPLGNFRAGVQGVPSSNYVRNFIARGYVQLSYTDGTKSDVIYSDVSDIRNIKWIAEQVINAGYGNDFVQSCVDAE